MPAKKIAKKIYAPDRASKLKATRTFVAGRATEWWDKEKRKPAGLKLCARCDAVWYDGHWHTAPNLAAALKAKTKGAKGGKEAYCEECRYAVHGPSDPKSALFEGELTLDGLIDKAEKARVLAAVRAAAKRAQKRDPEDRIVGIDDRGERVVVTTTENQLAVALGKAVDAAFKGGRLRIVWSSDDLPARVHWSHKKLN
jgi:hypothetical protein